jgi:uncharacterized membrane protein YvbJ
MFCRKCGAQNPEGAVNCSSCGAALSMNPYQATGFDGGSIGEKPKNYLVQSILVTLCCCLPLGIVGIVFAAQVDSKWNAGDQMGAIAAADNAKKFTLIGLVLGAVLNLLVFGIQILAVVGAAANAQNAGN